MNNGTDLNWMNVLINTDNSAGKSFSGFNYIINRSPKADGTTSIEFSKGGYMWDVKGSAKYVIKENVMQISIPLSVLGITADSCAIQFKVADNVTEYDDIMNYYVTGDSAPIGRLGYSYGY